MIGRSVSHYQFVEKLGAGGMGEIYRAQDTRLSRNVAIKVLPASHTGSPERRGRFLQEARAASALNHPNIITIHDVVVEDDTEFIVMEYVTGKTLTDLIPPTGLPLAEVLAYATQMADALCAAHAAGIVHRDLKPANVMVTPSGLVKILDFGLAKLAAPANTFAGLGDDTATLGGMPLTVEGSILGTVSYMSPEQAEGKPVDTRSDIFSFGVVLYEMITGRKAFAGDSALSTLSSILRDDVKPFSENAGRVPPVLDQVVRRCLAKNPAERWQSMNEVRTALAALKRESDSGTAIVPQAKRSSGLAPKLLMAAAAVAVVALAGWWAVRRATAPPTINSPAASVDTSPTPTPAPAAPIDGRVLTNDGVMAMVAAKVAPSVIIQQIRASETQFDLSTPQIIRLTQGGVTAEILDAMRNPKRPSGAGSKPSPSVPMPAVSGEKPGNTPTVSVPAVGTPAAPAPPAAAAPEPPAAPAITQSVSVPDGMPFSIRLAEEIPADAEPGLALRFTVTQELRVGDATVIAAGAAVTGEIMDGARKKLIGGTKLTFRLKEVTAADGKKIATRATPTRRGADSRRPVEGSNMPKHAKEIAAPAGTEYIAYSEGMQSVSVRK